MLFDPATLWAFAAATVAVYLAPGPDMAYIATHAMGQGLRAGVAAALGVVTGVWVQALAAALGMSALLAAVPWAFEAIRWAGIGYLLYLGVRLLRARDTTAGVAVATATAMPTIWWKGLGINLMNPKITVFMMSFLPLFADPARGSITLQLLVLGVAFAAGAIVWVLFLAWAFDRLRGALSGLDGVQTWQRRISGVAFLGFAGAMALAGVRR